MKIEIYGIKNCNTMKKAFDQLTAQGLSYSFHDYKKQGVTAALIVEWLKQVDEDVLLNKKGTTWKKLTAEQQQFALENQQQLIQSLVENPSMIKRPVLNVDGKIIVGFDEQVYQSITST